VDFLGWRIQRHRKRGTHRYYVCCYPAKKALRAVTGNVKTLCRQDTNVPLAVLLHRLNPALRGLAVYFLPAVSAATFQYLSAFTWRQVFGWLVVLAGGGIEIPRLLLLSRRVHRNRLGNGHDLVGRFFAERMTARTGYIVRHPRTSGAR